MYIYMYTYVYIYIFIYIYIYIYLYKYKHRCFRCGNAKTSPDQLRLKNVDGSGICFTLLAGILGCMAECTLFLTIPLKLKKNLILWRVSVCVNMFSFGGNSVIYGRMHIISNDPVEAKKEYLTMEGKCVCV